MDSYYNFPILRKMLDDLTSKTQKTPGEKELLGELRLLTDLVNSASPFQYLSVAPAAGRCPACGRPFKEPEL